MELSLAELAVKKAVSEGADEVEVYVQKRKVIQVEFAEKIESFKAVEPVGMSLRVVFGKRIALHSTSILSEDEVLEAAKKAVKLAKVAEEDPNWNHLNRKFGKGPAEGYYDKEVEDLGYEEI
ncbi:MAG TPA: hypothetical protein EYP68_08385, partial [Candidatus Korarchaeota archaeon]|nr:hypothetical protein [Candidatus Korarchaeota archaeon]